MRSEKANVVVGYDAGTYYTKAHSLTKTEYKLSPSDAQARDILTKKGIDFELVDLSRGLKVGLIAKFRGIRDTTPAARNRSPQAARRAESDY